MIKKILAVVLAAVLVVLCFAACGKKPKKEQIYGEEQAVAYNESGYAVFNDKGYLRVYDLDANGEIQKEADGSIMYKYYDVGGSIVHDNMYDCIYYAMKAPKGWTAMDNNTVVKDGTENACRIVFYEAQKTEDPTEFDSFRKQKVEDNSVIEEIVVSDMFTLGSKNLPAFSIKYPSTDGVVSSVYFLMNATIWKVDCVCDGGAGYDKDFDLTACMHENFVTK